MQNPIKKLIKAFWHSWDGLKAAYHHQWPFRVELLVCVIAIPVALFLGHNALERGLLISSLLLVLLAELTNSAIETVVDRISLEQHELSGRAKDIGSAVVLVAIIIAVVIWAAIIF